MSKCQFIENITYLFIYFIVSLPLDLLYVISSKIYNFISKIEVITLLLAWGNLVIKRCLKHWRLTHVKVTRYLFHSFFLLKLMTNR